MADGSGIDDPRVSFGNGEKREDVSSVGNGVSKENNDALYREDAEKRRARRISKFTDAILDEATTETAPDKSAQDALSEYKRRMSEIAGGTAGRVINDASVRHAAREKYEKKRGSKSDKQTTDKATPDDKRTTDRSSMSEPPAESKLNPHEGHRKRLRTAVSKDKYLDAMSDVEIMETVLSYLIPRKDTKAAAHEILERATLAQVLRDTPTALAGVKNVTELAVKVIEAISDVNIWHGASEVRLADRVAVVNYLGMILFGDGARGTHVAYLDKYARLIAHEVYSGDAVVDAKRIVGAVYAHDAAYVIVGRREYELFFSAFDYIESVDVLAEILENMDARLLDCLIFNEFGYYSLSGGAFGKGDGVFTFTPLSAVAASPDICEKLAKKAIMDYATNEKSNKPD